MYSFTDAYGSILPMATLSDLPDGEPTEKEKGEYALRALRGFYLSKLKEKFPDLVSDDFTETEKQEIALRLVKNLKSDGTLHSLIYTDDSENKSYDLTKCAKK